MKVVIYCQHVLGVGHFFRTLEIIKKMKGWQVILVTGGGKLDTDLPCYVRHIVLPGLMMDKDFSTLFSVDPDIDVQSVKSKRQSMLFDMMKQEKPDIFLIELYPFGRKAFRFELVPVLEYLRENRKGKCRVICSLRDILVEKNNPLKYETQVVDTLNRFFDAVMIHSDPALIKIDDTFSQIDKINLPIFYTGFITPLPDKKRIEKIHKENRLKKHRYMVVASAGGGNVGFPLLKSVVKAVCTLPVENRILLKVYTGPYMDEPDKAYLKSFAGPGIDVSEFTDDFVSMIGASDLSISMAGYNTCMNLVAAGVPSLVWPFDQNREQLKRAKAMLAFGPIHILENRDLEVSNLGSRICSILKEKKKEIYPELNLKGASQTVQWIKKQITY